MKTNKINGISGQEVYILNLYIIEIYEIEQSTQRFKCGFLQKHLEWTNESEKQTEIKTNV